MNSSKIGSAFEIITKDFFVWLFNEIGLTITKNRIQFSGNQNGFDVHFKISKDYLEHNIHIESKGYSKDLAISNIIQKAIEIESSGGYMKNENDLFIAINHKANFSNKNNPEKVDSTLQKKFDFRIELLDLSNGIKELYALNPDFYREVYNEDVSFPINKKKAIKRFKSILFSRKPLQTIVINEKDKEKYIGTIAATEHYIPRTFSNDRNDTGNHIYFLGEKPKEIIRQRLEVIDSKSLGFKPFMFKVLPVFFRGL